MLGKKIKELRTRNGDTLETLSKKIGVSANYISLLERGERKPSAIFFTKLMNVYKNQDLSELKQEFFKTKIPTELLTTLNINQDKDSQFLEIVKILFSDTSDELKKNVLHFLLIQKELETYKNGTYEQNKKEIEKIKKMIDNL